MISSAVLFPQKGHLTIKITSFIKYKNILP
nr:MAG TPA: hypothetical protein [Caudoviricetes sp.]